MTNLKGPLGGLRRAAQLLIPTEADVKAFIEARIKGAQRGDLREQRRLDWLGIRVPSSEPRSERPATPEK